MARLGVAVGRASSQLDKHPNRGLSSQDSIWGQDVCWCRAKGAGRRRKGPALSKEHAGVPGSCCHARDSHAHTNRAGYFFPLRFQPCFPGAVCSVQLKTLVLRPLLQGKAEGEVEWGVPCPDKGRGSGEGKARG